MKNVIWVVVIVLAVVLVFGMMGAKDKTVELDNIGITAGQKFENMDYPENTYVLDYRISDINGDGKNDTVILVGQKEAVDNPFATGIDLVVHDGEKKEFLKTGLKKLEGYSANISLNDFTGDKQPDVLITVGETNECTTFHFRMVQHNGNGLEEIMKDRDSKGVNFVGTFLDGFKVELRSRKLNKTLAVDLSDSKENYINNKFYDESGRLLKKEAKVTTENFYMLEPVQLSDRFGLKGSQRIKGFDDLDVIDVIETIWKYEDGKWILKEAKGTRMGNLMY